jgi:hypothetical protein
MNTPLVSLDILSFLVATGFGFFCAGAAGATFVAVSPMMSLTSRDDAIVAFLSFEYGLVRCSNEDVQVANARLTCRRCLRNGLHPPWSPHFGGLFVNAYPQHQNPRSGTKIITITHLVLYPPIKLLQDGRTCDESVGHPARPTSQYHKSS